MKQNLRSFIKKRKERQLDEENKIKQIEKRMLINRKFINVPYISTSGNDIPAKTPRPVLCQNCRFKCTDFFKKVMHTLLESR